MNEYQNPQGQSSNAGIGMPAAPQIELPQGGGALQGIGEKFQANPVTGTASLSLPIAMSQGRNGFSPALTLSYDSGSGNSPYGLGWNLDLPQISRKTTKGFPKYQDEKESDVFLLSGAEDLVPFLKENMQGGWIREERSEGNYKIYAYRPRTEGLFAIIERWVHQASSLTHWKTVSKENITTLYGIDEDSRIADPDHPERIFTWLIARSWDDQGNVVEYKYKKEDTVGVGKGLIYEKHRLRQNAWAQRYLKEVRYGNTLMHDDNDGELPFGNEWLFRLVLDYGDHPEINPQPDPEQGWTVREDAFSSYRSGFDIRSWRLCRRFLMFHTIKELKKDENNQALPALVKATLLNHEENKTAAQLVSVTHRSYDPITNTFADFPPVSFSYSSAKQDINLHSLDVEDINELPGGVDGKQKVWIDLEGEGLPGILSDSGEAWYYKRNLGDRNIYKPLKEQSAKAELHFEPFSAVLEKPNGAQAAHLEDIDGDGIQEAVLREETLKGVYERSWEGKWLYFRSFDPVPNIDWQDPNLRMIDLDGDGLADLLITEDRCFRWYRNEEGKGYGNEQLISKPFDEEQGPALVFNNGEESIYTADMSGDGMTDLVRIRNGEVCYWPNLGFGQFGKKITLAGNALFDYPDLFNQDRIRLADVDGSGTTDIIYFEADKIVWYANHCGNSLSKAKEIRNFLPVDNLTGIQVLDLLGKGTACIVWSSPLPHRQGTQIHYIDLMGEKPYLLTSIRNNTGGEQRMEYTPSTTYYLKDKRAGMPWVTKLPFPVHTLSKVTTYDHISGTKLVSRYAYHHGYYDRHEREFRGFGRVEQWDTELFNLPAGKGFFPIGTNEEGIYKTAPIHTKTWFHNGYFEEASDLLQAFKKEYYQGDAEAWILPENILPETPHAGEWRDAHRALKGQVLRTEVYGEGNIPYSVSESNYEVKLVQPQKDNRHASFLCVPAETLHYQYEQEAADPRISHELTIETDHYGMPLWTAQVAYGRRGTGWAEAQSQTKISLTKQNYIHLNESQDHRRIGLPYEVETWELTGKTPESGKPFQNGINGDLFLAYQGAVSIEYESDPDFNQIQKRRISHVQALYYDENLINHLPLGEAAYHGILYKSRQLVLSQSMKNTIYADFAEVTDSLLEGGGYEKIGNDFYLPSSVYIYDADAFYTIIKSTDPFGEETSFAWDDYSLFPIQTEDALGNVTTSEIDYRVLDYWQMTDANGNRTALAFDTLGLVHKTAVMGKVGNNEGDTLEFPTTELEYDLFQYLNHEQPNYAYTKAREIHGDPNTRWLESYTYTDGLGRVLLEKVKVAPGKAFIFIDGELQYGLDEKPLIDDADPRWLGSGRIVYNNKGEAVKQYEPYFSNTPEYEKESEAREFGVSPLLHYDALGRNNRIDHPDGSFEQVVFDCWQQKNYDRNDTVKDSEWYAERGSPQPSDPEPTDPRERAAWLAIKHYDTPEILDLDVLGVIYRQRHDNGTYDGITTTHIYYDTIFETDIEGKRRKVTDARELEISYQYDMRPVQEDEEGNSNGGTVIQSESPDSGLKIQLVCVDGQPLFAVDAVGNHFLYDYDALRRPLRIKTKMNGAASYITTALYEYGESLVNPEQDNFRGQLYRMYDTSGLSQNKAFDFKGNLLGSQKQLLEDATLSEVDWEGNTSPDLSTEVFESSMTYDALDRVVTQTDPGSNVTEHLYDEGGALKTVKLNEANYVQDIHYNEKGQRKDIWYGNGTKTSYTYDTKTFRLRRLLTVKLGSNEILQDLNYWYDPVGNITEIQDDAQQTLFFNNSVIAPTQKFVYDALYRLIEAKGRELIGTADFGTEDNWNDAVWKTSYKGDGSAVQNYIQKYIYDEVGNVLELQHTAGVGSYTRIYEIDSNSNRLLSTEVGSHTYSYSHDSRGNMTAMPHLSAMNWNTQNELKSILKGSEPTYYQYSNGERVRKFTDKGTIKEERIYLGNFEIYRKFEGGSLTQSTGSVPKVERTTVHVNDDTGRIAMLEKRTAGSAADDNGTAESLERYIYSNHLQSASLELDETGAIISYEEYHPYGTTSYQANNSDIKAVAKRYRYTGKERDEESGLYYHGARYYVPWLARWAAVDPLENEYAGMSSYNYGFNNPVIFNDPSGMEGEEQVSGGFESGVGTSGNPVQLATVDIVENRDLPWYTSFGFNEYGYYRNEYSEEGFSDLYNYVRFLDNAAGSIWNLGADIFHSFKNFSFEGLKNEVIGYYNYYTQTGISEQWEDTKTPSQPKTVDTLIAVTPPKPPVTEPSKPTPQPNKEKNEVFSTIGTVSTMSASVPTTIEEGTKLITKTANYTDDIARIGKIANYSAKGLGFLSLGTTHANYRRNSSSVSEGRYYTQQAINVIGFFGPWGVGISIALSIIEVGYGDEIEKWIRQW